MNKKEKRITDFYEAWLFLNEHEIVYLNGVNYFYKCLDIEVVKVSPETLTIENDTNLNTKTQVWLEFGGIIKDENFGIIMPCHDINLDCGADTFEEAITKLANLVNNYY